MTWLIPFILVGLGLWLSVIATNKKEGENAALTNCKDCKKEVSRKAKTCPHCGAKPKSSSIVNILLVISVLFLITMCTQMNSSPTNYGERALIKSAQDGELQNAINQIELKYDWQISGFGNVMLASFTLKNKAGRYVKDIIIECELAGQSGTSLNAVSTTIYKTLKPNEVAKAKDVNMGFINSQATNASCEVVGLKF